MSAATIKRPRRIRPEEARDARAQLQDAFRTLRDARTNPDYYDGRRVVYETLGAIEYRLITALAFLDVGPTGKDFCVRDRELRHEMEVADKVREGRKQAARDEALG